MLIFTLVLVYVISTLVVFGVFDKYKLHGDTDAIGISFLLWFFSPITLPIIVSLWLIYQFYLKFIKPRIIK